MTSGFLFGGGYTPSPPPTTLDPSNTASDITLSGGNLVATANTTNASGNLSRSTNSTSSVKKYCEVTIGTNAGPNTNGVGIANASQAVTNNHSAGETGNNSIGYFTGGVYQNGLRINSGPTPFTTGAVIGIAIDPTAQLLWLNVNGGAWNVGITGGGTQNPATGQGGYSTSALGAGALFVVVEVDQSGDTVTANFTPSSPPAGFGNL